jgi:hypothetical protein
MRAEPDDASRQCNTRRYGKAFGYCAERRDHGRRALHLGAATPSPGGAARVRHARRGENLRRRPRRGRGWGVRIAGDDEATRPEGVERIELRDLDLDTLRSAFESLGVDPRVDGFALACLDHGAAPPGYSDRLFRFEHLLASSKENNLGVCLPAGRRAAHHPSPAPCRIGRSDVPSASSIRRKACTGVLQDKLSPPSATGCAQHGQLARAGVPSGWHAHLQLFEHHTGLLSRETWSR